MVLQLLPAIRAEPSEVIADFDEAIRLHAEDARAFYNRGLAQARLERHEAAAADYAEARRFSNRGNAKRDLGRLEESFADFDQALALQPNLRAALSGPLSRYLSG